MQEMQQIYTIFSNACRGVVVMIKAYEGFSS